MPQKHSQPLDDVSSAPESGTVCDDTSGNKPSDRGCNPGQGRAANNQGGQRPNPSQEKDDPAIAGEER